MLIVTWLRFFLVKNYKQINYFSNDYLECFHRCKVLELSETKTMKIDFALEPKKKV